MNVPTITLGGLTCRVVDRLEADSPPALVVVLCHGFGAPASDLVPLGQQILSSRSSLERVRFVFPAAPLFLDSQGLFGGRAWWHVDVAKLAEAVAQGRLRDLRGELPPEMPEARRLLLSLVAEIQSKWQVPASRIVLGGFSQGSVLAMDVALRMDSAPAAVAVFSGTLMCEDQWRELIKKRAGLKVLQSHGRFDMVLPYQGALWLKDLLDEAGADIEFIPFDGDHTIPPEAFESLMEMLDELA